MSKILYVTTIDLTINTFLVPHIEHLIAEGHQVDCACRIINGLSPRLIDKGVKAFDIPFDRNPIKLSNLKCINIIQKIFKKEPYDIVHVHTPVASFVTRLSLRRKKTEIIYTCHGFHFYEGAPILNWLLYYPLERIAARWTDKLVTINNEDFEQSKKFNLRHSGKTFMINGVGIEPKEYKVDKLFNRDTYRQKLGVRKEDTLLLVVAEINKNKNHIQLIKALEVISEITNIKILCAGEGPLKANLINYAKKLNLEQNILFLGFRKDIKELLNCSDCVALFSKREGLPRCLIEGLITDNTLLGNNIRGINSIINGKNGYLLKVNDYKDTAKKIIAIKECKNSDTGYGKEKYYLCNILKEISHIHNV